MAGLVERSENRRYELERKRHKRRVVFTSVFSVLATVFLFAYIINGFLNKYYGGFQVTKTTVRKDSNTVKYVKANGNILKYSRDGASLLGSGGNILWNGSYNMKNPVEDICNEFVAIADIGGKEVYVFNGKDSGTRIETPLPIIEVEVAGQGVVAVVLEDISSNVIQLYNPYDSNQKKLVDIPTNVQTDGYPLDITLSEDGKKLVTSYVQVQDGVPENHVGFYVFNKIGDNAPNNLVAAQKFGQNLIPKVEFLNNDFVCLYGEKTLKIYSKMNLPEKIFSKTFKDPIKSVFTNKSHVGVVLDGHNRDEGYHLIIYNLSGKVVLDQQIDYDYDHVFMGDKEVVFYADLECIILRFTGREKFHYTFEKNIEYFLPIDNKEKYVIIDEVNIQEIKLTEDKSK